jgi:copper transport protein
LSALALAAVGVLAAAPAASAHATLESTSPASGSIVSTAPSAVSATFDEAVGVSPDSLRVFAPDGRRADDGRTILGRTPQQITVGLLPGLGRGTYTVGWHVISADSHPVQGAFTFSVGAPSSTVVTPASLGPLAGKLVGFVFGVVRWLAFCCFALLVGEIAFVICCWPAGAGRSGVLRLAMGAWSGLAAATLAAILLQGVYGAGQSIGHVFWPDVMHATLHSRYGLALGARLLLTVVALVAFSMTLGSLRAAGASRRARCAAGAVWAAITVGLASTWSLADHAGVGVQVPLSVPSDILHLTAVAVWMGGLATLVAIVLRRPESAGATRKFERRRYQAATAEAAQAVSRFSPIALACVCVIVATGTYQAWRGVGSFGALFGTLYGRLLLAKIVALCALVGLGNLARQRVQRLRAPVAAIVAAHTHPVPARESAQANLVTVRAGTRGKGSRSSTRARRVDLRDSIDASDGEAQLNADRAVVTLTRLRWSVSVEVVIVTAVLAATAVLVNTPTRQESYNPTAASAAAVSAPFDTGGPQGRGSVSVLMTPGAAGPNRLRVAVTGDDARPYRPQEIDAVLALPARDLGPLPAKLTEQQPKVYLSAPVIVTIAGQWQVRITIRSDAFDETTVTVPVTLR